MHASESPLNIESRLNNNDNERYYGLQDELYQESNLRISVSGLNSRVQSPTTSAPPTTTHKVLLLTAPSTIVIEFPQDDHAFFSCSYCKCCLIGTIGAIFICVVILPLFLHS